MLSGEPLAPTTVRSQLWRGPGVGGTLVLVELASDDAHLLTMIVEHVWQLMACGRRRISELWTCRYALRDSAKLY